MLFPFPRFLLRVCSHKQLWNFTQTSTQNSIIFLAIISREFRIHFISTRRLKLIYIRFYFKQTQSHLFAPRLFVLFFMVNELTQVMCIAQAMFAFVLKIGIPMVMYRSSFKLR